LSATHRGAACRSHLLPKIPGPIKRKERTDEAADRRGAVGRVAGTPTQGTILQTLLNVYEAMAGPASC